MADTMKSKQPKTNFTSYLNEEILNGDEAADDATPKPRLLAGELAVVSAQNVKLLPPPNETLVCHGLLVVTNFKLSFVVASTTSPTAAVAGGVVDQHQQQQQQQPKPQRSATSQENAFVGQHDVTLTNIDSIYQVVGAGGKRRQLVPGSGTKISSKLHGLHVVCKNFRVLVFDLSACQVGEAKRIAEGLMKFAFPNQHSLLFSYNYRENYYNTLRNITMFNKRADWAQELVRCGATGWRVLSVEREDSIPTGTLPMHYAIPRTIKESDYLKLANYFRNTRGAIWVFSLGDAALVRMAELLPTISNTLYENQMLEFVRTCSPARAQPHIIELSKCVPSVQDVQASYAKLKELCTAESDAKFAGQDQRYYTHLEKSSWLLHVSLCLQYAAETAEQLRAGTTVVLQECDGRDTSAIVSSVAQLLLDPTYRTLSGFASLVQKDWVALGHPFSDRLGHVVNAETTEQSPLWLLFLDAVWQLVQQFPGEFEFNETFLTTVWDAAYLPIFDTFLFNCEHDRQAARKNLKLVLRPVWDWGEQFSDKDMLLFTNPLYRRPLDVPSSRQSMAVHLPASAIRLPGLANNRMTLNLTTATSPKASSTTPYAAGSVRHLQPQFRICDLAIWHQCYHRWLPVLDLHNGGTPQIDLYHRLLLANIARLQQALQTGDYDDLPTPTNLPAVNAFFPFGSATDAGTSGLEELLTRGHDALADGSIFDGLSVSMRD